MREISAKMILLATICVLGLGACSAQVGVMSVISTQKVAVNEKARGEQKVSGESCSVMSLASLDEAVRDALNKAGPDYDALIHTIVSHRLVPFYHNCFTVTGTPINTKAGMAGEGQ